MCVKTYPKCVLEQTKGKLHKRISDLTRGPGGAVVAMVFKSPFKSSSNNSYGISLGLFKFDTGSLSFDVIFLTTTNGTTLA